MQLLKENEEMDAQRKATEDARWKQEQEEDRRHIDNFAHTRIMQEVSRPGVIDEFKGFDKSRIDEYNKAIEQ